MKYFYNCPIKSAYMAKYFGMKFENPFDGEIDFSVLDVRDRGRKQFKFYLHPDSLHLLEPQVWDLFQWVRDSPSATPYQFTGWYILADGFTKDDGFIIQRNGAPFMWPEMEK